jgi:protein MpaA
VGEIHGDEPAGTAVTRALRKVTPPAGIELLVLDDANPDGRAASTRGNAHGVDLNRSFPWGWRPLGPPGNLYYAGPRPSSEPETRAIEALVLRERPSVTIWYHQHLDLVDLQPGSSARLMRLYARISALPARRLPLLPGTASRWENHRLPGGSSFVVELPAGALDAASIQRHVRAVVAVGDLLIRPT